MVELEGRRAKHPGSSLVSIPSLTADISGQQHEITCVSLVLLNSHKDKASEPSGHRKELIVLYNSEKVRDGAFPELDEQLTASVGISEARRIKFFPCSGEFALLCKLVWSLAKREIELLYMYCGPEVIQPVLELRDEALFDLRVINQRMNYYAAGCCGNRGHRGVPRSQGLNLLRLWNNLFMSEAFGGEAKPSFEFEIIRFLEMHQEMLVAVGKLVYSSREALNYGSYQLEVTKFNKNKSKLGHFKMNSCGMNVIDLFRVAATRSTKFTCNSMKLNNVAPYLINSVRKVSGQPEKDSRKLFKVAEVSYEKMDGMIHEGGKGLFAVLVYNLAGKDTFGGFVQSTQAVQIPQLKYRLDNFRATVGPRGREHPERTPWAPEQPDSNLEEWQGGAVCTPLTGLHYSGPGMGLELSFDFSGMYPSIMCALNISPETTVPWPSKDFAYNLSGWVCYSWEREGFPYASLIMKYDPEKRAFVRDRAVMSSSVENYLNRRADYKKKLKSPDLSDEQRSYYKTQEGEYKCWPTPSTAWPPTHAGSSSRATAGSR
ncbi:hypothetical protein SKAU_G00426420 [Synaphobranchus kaupii]|uniref:DNA-directed DNA polymerase n=1 Tax=Synaphobranchus kaupii TaxID=118154 RepID=A0A9Q1E590_SYNKA|nr:hypothetical protein SKAU_G00426420 [Synaphobranchus kaupii]